MSPLLSLVGFGFLGFLCIKSIDPDPLHRPCESTLRSTEFRELLDIENSCSEIFSEAIANKFEFQTVDDKEGLRTYWMKSQEKDYFKSFDAVDNCDKSIRLGNLYSFEKITGTKLIDLEKYEIDNAIKSLGKKIGQSIMNVDIPNFIYYMILVEL